MISNTTLFSVFFLLTGLNTPNQPISLLIDVTLKRHLHSIITSDFSFFSQRFLQIPDPNFFLKVYIAISCLAINVTKHMEVFSTFTKQKQRDISKFLKPTIFVYWDLLIISLHYERQPSITIISYWYTSFEFTSFASCCY